MTPRRVVVVVGIGNPMRSDDGAGVAVARAIAAAAPADVTVVEQAEEPAALLDVWCGAHLAIVVDAVRGTGPPGRVHCMEVGQATILSRSRPHSSHGLGLGDTIQLARALGRLPARLVLIGIQGADFGHGQRLSPPVASAVARVSRAILREARAAAAFPARLPTTR